MFRLPYFFSFFNLSFSVGELLLCVSCILKDLGFIKFLLNSGVGINAMSSRNSVLSPLFIACKNQDVESASFLIQQKVDVNTLVAETYPEIVGQILER